MPSFKDLSGQRFFRLVVKFRVPNPKRTIWRCICDCGEECDVWAGALYLGTTKSCGCYYRETRGANRTHNRRNTPEFEIWSAIKQRCLNPKNRVYKNYGGRGIAICERWRVSFSDFLADIGLRPSPELTLDRINNDGNYEPGNCRWASYREQSLNRRGNRRIEAFGKTKTITEWAAILGTYHGHLAQSIRNGHTVEWLAARRGINCVAE